MNENGWILLSRKFPEWQWWGKAEMVKLWLYLLLSANIEDKKWQGIEIKRGQFVTSRAHLAAAANLSEQTVRTCLARLQQTGEITIKTTKQLTLITICNFGIYQDYVPNNQPTINQQSTNNQPTINQQLTTTKQYNNNILKEEVVEDESKQRKTKFFEGKPTPNPVETSPEEKEKNCAKKEKDFVPPTVKQVKDFCEMHGLTAVNPTLFVAHYESIDWTTTGNTHVKNWQSLAVKWNEVSKQRINSQKTSLNKNGNYNNRQAGQSRHASIEPRGDARPEDF